MHSSKLEWSAGGWFGSQLGGTCWILVAAVLSALRDISLGLVLLCVFTAPNIVGYVLWHQKKLSCYAAMQSLIAIVGVSGLVAIFVLDQSRMWLEIQSGGEVSVASAYRLVVSVTAILMLVFYVRFGRHTDGSAN